MDVAAYCRVSTADQSLERQLTATNEYAQDRLGAEPTDVVTYRDKSTGTDTARDGYRDMVDAVEGGEHDAVVVTSISRISRSIRDLDHTAERIVDDGGTELHFVNEGMELTGDNDPFQTAMFRLLGVFAEFEAEIGQQRTREGIAARQANPEYHHGPAPLGFEKDDGELVESNVYDRVCATLDMVAKGDLSKRKAASELDTSWPTIRRALDNRPELYGL